MKTTCKSTEHKIVSFGKLSKTVAKQLDIQFETFRKERLRRLGREQSALLDKGNTSMKQTTSRKTDVDDIYVVTFHANPVTDKDNADDELCIGYFKADSEAEARKACLHYHDLCSMSQIMLARKWDVIWDGEDTYYCNIIYRDEWMQSVPHDEHDID